MDTTKYWIFAFLVAAAGTFWLKQAQHAEQLAYQNQDQVMEEDTSDLDFSFSESSAHSGRLKSCPDIDFNVQRQLKLGDTGDDVKQLQRFLVAYYPSDNPRKDRKRVTGNFGADTETLLKTFQKDHGLTQSGIFNYDTASVVNEEMSFVCRPKITAINPQSPQRGQQITITGVNFTTVMSFQVQMLHGISDNHYANATSSDTTTTTYTIPTELQTNGQDVWYNMRVKTRWGKSNVLKITVHVPDSGQGGGAGKNSDTCTALSTYNTCVANSKPICEWYNKACKLPSCGALAFFTGKDDPTQYELTCAPFKNPGSDWALLGPTDDCGWTEGSTKYGCFYRAKAGPNPPNPNPPRNQE